MTIGNEFELAQLRDVGRIVAVTLQRMGEALEPGMTTKELDDIGAAELARHGATSAPSKTYDFPGATCISINPAIAHGIPSERVIQAGDLINIDVSAEKDGFWADTGASFIVPPATAAKQALCRTTRKALKQALKAVRAGQPINVIGQAIEQVARRGNYSIIRNLQSHGVGGALHEEPAHIPSYYDPADTRELREGMVFTIEPFLSTGAEWADEEGDGWTLSTPPEYLTAQYEHSLVVTKGAPIILTAA